ncbi:uncharacterized protein HD556DRAFT_1313631 [Suillus plorans]|uniref:Uncharacterized protein n=1 Tax=Suillus plorans TaxID=116603 RepID=A0A9P7A8E7_9AGAM|nr:uncharacterized protein HD556DRAFT_1315189 [Suillus plorans]XP_041151884.1 uncharacterized protein HD556DRAFT_1315115 [Suillus plorans]XP_041153750.1 uncharacterized protein HD556DRAFT_1313631 [Suillus plorans]KAG1784314.1 hypothetical protein HD556DRAFT_1315189 [Suillus plorans]KAG1784399.1 hypothetical protein HD556DRAFT_1315115 [Suillus plorans]KAG1786289.1 hypothetical protein HD556DRAFT_1313631 [Suillus plorans]
MNNNNQFSRFNLFFRLTFIILLHPLFLPVPLLQGDFRCTPLGSCRLQLQEFKGTTLQSPFKHSFSRTLDGAVRATPPFERPPVPNLEPLLPLSAFQFLKLFCLLELGVAQCMPLRSACHLLVAPAYWDWGSAQCMPLVSGSCSNFLMVTAEPAGTFVWQVLSS